MQRNKTYIRSTGVHTVILEILMFTDFLSKFNCTINSAKSRVFFLHETSVCICCNSSNKNTQTQRIYLTKFLFLLQSCLSFNI